MCGDVSATEAVPVCEVRGVVPLLQAVVQLVVGCPAAQPGQQPVEAPGQVVAAVVLHSQPAVEQVEGSLAERVAAQQPATGHGQEQQGEQLGAAEVLGRQGNGDPMVLVVGQVHMVVEPPKPGEGHTPMSMHPSRTTAINTIDLI